MPRMTAADCVAFCFLVASAVWIAAIWICKGVASESGESASSESAMETHDLHSRIPLHPPPVFEADSDQETT